MDNNEILMHVDHTLLKPTATWQQIQKLCQEAINYGMAAVCISPSFVQRAAEIYGQQVKICTVIGFPLGSNTSQSKICEAQDAIANGAAELDMVINLHDVKEGCFANVVEEIKALREVANDSVLKVIVETCYLTVEEKIMLCKCVSEAGADFIKTSTGFGSAGANLQDIELFKQHLDPKVKIKASGGIRSKEDFENFILAGCERIGASSAVTALVDSQS